MFVSALIISASAISMGLFTVSAEAATPPSTMNFQGRLKNSSDQVVADGLYNMQFRIYDASTGGTLVWSETRQTTSRVQVTNGLFSVQLGQVTPLTASIFNATNLFFEITMATPATANCSTAGCAAWESPMTPRNKLATSAYAFNAATLNGKSDTDFAAASGSANYLHNTTSPQTASFSVSGSGAVGTTLTVGGATNLNNTTTVRTTSTTAFRIQNASSSDLLVADTTNNKVMIGSATNGIEFSANGMVLSGTARGSDRLTVSAEYPGLTFRGDGANNDGNLSSDFCSQPLGINTSACSTGVATNYYQWTTTQTTAQDYDLYFKMRYPDRASPSSGGGVVNFTMDGFVTATATDSVSATIFKGATTCGTYNIATVNNTWTTTSMSTAFGTCNFAAGEEMVIRIKLTAGQNNFARVGDIQLTYRTQR